jgi:glycine cleavage system H protein
MIPEDLNYTKDHEWVRLETGAAVIGISDHAQKEMGDLVFVELPQVGDVVKTGQAMGSVESVKAVSEILAPLSGKIAEVNEALADQPELVNEDPYGAGWLARITLAEGSQIEGLMTAAEYRSFLAEES